MARTQAIADVLTTADGSPIVRGTVRFQLVSSAALLAYHVTGDSADGELVDSKAVNVTTDGAGNLTASLVAPGDLLDPTTGSTPAVCYYLITLPSGSQMRTTAFGYSATPVSLAAIDAAAPSPAYTTAPVAFQVVRPDAAGDTVTVSAYLNIDAAIGSIVLRAQDRFTTTLDATGMGTLNLPPNSLIAPSGTFYWVDLGSGSRYPIVVPPGGGSFVQLLTTPLPAGSLSPSSVSAPILIGTLAGRPTTAQAGTFYYATDWNGGTLYLYTGSAWSTAGGVSSGLAGVYAPLTDGDPTNPLIIFDSTGAALVARIA